MPTIRVRNLPVTTTVEADVEVPEGPGPLDERIAAAALAGNWSPAGPAGGGFLLDEESLVYDDAWRFEVVPYASATPAAPSGRGPMTFGTMPSREQYDAAWDAVEAVATADGFRPPHMFHFGNDPRMGSLGMTRDELWAELVRAHAEYDVPGPGAEEAGEWCSDVLGRLGIEWV